MDLIFLQDKQSGTHLVAVLLASLGLMLIVHNDTVACYEARAYEPDRYTEVPALWSGDELKTRVLDWSSRVNDAYNKGIEAWWAGK